MNKYIISLLLGSLFTIFVLDYIKVRKISYYNNVRVSNIRKEISELHSDIWDLDDEQSIISRIHDLEKN